MTKQVGNREPGCVVPECFRCLSTYVSKVLPEAPLQTLDSAGRFLPILIVAKVMTRVMPAFTDY